MKANKLTAPLMIVSICIGAARGDLVTLSAGNSAGGDAVVTPGGVSELIQVRVVNNSTPDDPADYLTGWQLSLSFVPQAGATGQLTFNSPATGTASEPTDYLLQGVNFQITVDNSGVDFEAFDVNLPFSGGVEVPTDPGASLVTFDVLASADASGSFDIVAFNTNDLTRRTEWTDATPGVQLTRSFANVPFGAGALWIGSISVVPEPSSCLFAACVTLALTTLSPSRRSRRV